MLQEAAQIVVSTISQDNDEKFGYVSFNFTFLYKIHQVILICVKAAKKLF